MPGIFERMGNILRANINDLLDQAEDPEKMINQIIRDMEDAIRDARVQVRDMLAQQKLLEQDLARAQSQSNEWGRKAELAVTQDRDDLAREALRRKNDFQAQADVYGKQLTDQQALVNRLRAQLTEIESKYESAKRNRDTLLARKKAAEAKEKMATTASQLKDVPDFSSDLARMERKISEQEARASATAEMSEARASVDKQFEALEDPAVEDELAALKARMGKGPAPAGGTAAATASASDADADAQLEELKARINKQPDQS